MEWMMTLVMTFQTLKMMNIYMDNLTPNSQRVHNNNTAIISTTNDYINITILIIIIIIYFIIYYFIYLITVLIDNFIGSFLIHMSKQYKFQVQ